MPIDFGVAGYDLTVEERVGMLVQMAGGPVKAAALLGRSRAHIDNMRKEGAPLRVDDLLPLCREAGVSLDWVATGYQVRPDVKAAPVADAEAGGAASPGGAAPVQVLPVRPQRTGQAGKATEISRASDFSVSAAWLEARKLPPDAIRYAILEDDGMEPRLGKGALALVDTRPGPARAGLYVVGVGDELLARRLIRLPDGSGELLADNDPQWRFALPADGNGGLLMHRIVWAGQDF